LKEKREREKERIRNEEFLGSNGSFWNEREKEEIKRD